MLDIYGNFEWPGDYYGSYYGQVCQEPNAVVSIYASVYTYCTEEEIEFGIKSLSDYCEKYGEIPLAPASEFAANLTKEAISQIRVLNQDDLVEDSNVTAPFVVAPAWYSLSYRTEQAWQFEERTHVHYLYAGYGFWAIIIFFGVVQNVVRKVVEKRRGYVYSDAEASGRAASSKAGSKANIFVRSVAFVRKHFTTPSALPPFHQTRFLGCSIPTRAETFVVIAYWIISIILSGVNIHGFEGNLYWPQVPAQVWRYLADRTGIMSYGNFPLMWVFSGRNNVFLWMTGWSFGTFNIFHRHVARIATLQGIIHSIGYTCYFFTAGYGEYYKADFEELWYAIGFAATVVMSFIVLFSFSYFRNKLYENFLIVHIVLSVLLLVFLYYHTNIFDLDEYNQPFLISAAALWGFDRFLRLVRQAYVNLHVHRSGLKLKSTAKATVSYEAAGNMITIDVIPGNNKLFAAPGQHYYLYQPLRLLGWENHPFTLGHWSHDADGDLHLQFWARPYDGWTKKLMNECIKKGGETATIQTPILLEGPYGKSEPTHTFEEVLLVAGGSGIAGVFPYLLDHVRRTEQGAAAAASGGRIPTRTRHINLIWSDRSDDYMRFIADGPLAQILKRADVTVSMYNSKRAAGNVSDVGSSASSSTDNVDSTAGSAEKTVDENAVTKPAGKSEAGNTRDYTIHAGRPDVLAAVRGLAQSIKGTEARLAVMVCGPTVLADSVRLVVADSMETDRDSIEYFEESFGW